MKTFLNDYIQSKPKKMISYAEFMEITLYHPQFGYYMKKKEKIGRKGDFITTSNISAVFGQIIARWFASLVKEEKLPAAFCEIGAGNGRFAKAFIEEWNEHIGLPLTYTIVEKSPYHLAELKELLYGKSEIVYASSLRDIASFQGMIFSNELFDALPVHVIQKNNGQLQEVMVACDEGQLFEQEIPLSNEEIFAYLEKYEVELTEGQRIEVPLAMIKMAKEMFSSLSEGMLVTVDYGYTGEEWKAPERRDGSLRGYYQHQMIDNPLCYPGEMDLTSHIHWDTLTAIGREQGMKAIKLWWQDEFLLHIGILEMLAENYDANPFSETSKRNRAIRSLIMPGSMSAFFQVLVQEK